MSEIWEAIPRAYHYTSWDGLVGILETQTLWAFHYKSLNDFTEIDFSRELLEKRIYNIVNPIMRQAAKSSVKYNRFLDKHGGLANTSRTEAKNIVNAFYATAFEGRDRSEPFAVPYIVSFCAHIGHENYVKENGLLSMWRGYGNDGGFALVFDVKKLWEIMQAEQKYYGYPVMDFGKVFYSDADEEKLRDEFSTLWDALDEFIPKIPEGAPATPVGALLGPLFSAVTRYKHEGFKEESEVRLSVSLPSGEIRQGVGGSEKLIHILKKPRADRPYIILNESPKPTRLPITKIIVGPQKNQNARVNKVRSLVKGKGITVTKSHTPFIPA